jgi:hypothetical protein
MKTFTMNLMLAAAIMTAASTTLSAQTYRAEIPFSFRASTAVLPAGTYEFRTTGVQPILMMRNVDPAKGNVLLHLSVPHDAPAAWRATGRASLGFACTDRGCRLREVWTGAGQARSLPNPKVKEDADFSRAAMIRIAASRIQ